jgi:hypothetical protein
LLCNKSSSSCMLPPTHMNLVKHILRYIKGTINHGFHLSRSPSSELVIYSDADWAGCPDTRRSTSGFCAFLGNNLISWSSKRQNRVSRSSAEAEYCGIANAVAESSWLRQLLIELGHPPRRATIIFYDNVSAAYMLTCTLCRTKYLLAMSKFYKYPPQANMRIYLQRVFLRFCSRISTTA